jgi:hypothetical protein
MKPAPPPVVSSFESFRDLVRYTGPVVPEGAKAMDVLRAYGVCRSCFEPYDARRGCLRCDRDADARVPVAEAAGVLPIDIEAERQPELHRMMPRPLLALVGGAFVVVILIAAAIQVA